MAVGVDEPGNDRRPAGIDDAIAAVGVRSLVVVTHPDDHSVLDEHALVESEVGTRGVGDGGGAIQRSHGLTLRNHSPGLGCEGDIYPLRAQGR